MHQANTRDVARAEIERAWAGDVDAQRALHRRLQPVIQRAIAGRLRPLAMARGRDVGHALDDFIQGTWMRLFDKGWRVLWAYDPERADLEAYVATIADRHVLAQMRTKCHNPYFEVPVDHADLEHQGELTDDAFEQVRSRAELEELQTFLVARLDERGLVLFRMLELEGLGPSEVAERAEMTVNAVYQWRRRVRVLVHEWREQRDASPDSARKIPAGDTQ